MLVPSSPATSAAVLALFSLANLFFAGEQSRLHVVHVSPDVNVVAMSAT